MKIINQYHLIKQIKMNTIQTIIVLFCAVALVNGSCLFCGWPCAGNTAKCSQSTDGCPTCVQTCFGGICSSGCASSRRAVGELSFENFVNNTISDSKFELFKNLMDIEYNRQLEVNGGNESQLSRDVLEYSRVFRSVSRTTCNKCGLNCANMGSNWCSDDSGGCINCRTFCSSGICVNGCAP